MIKPFYAVRLPPATRDLLFDVQARLCASATQGCGTAVKIPLHDVVMLALGSLSRELRGVPAPQLDVVPAAARVEQPSVIVPPQRVPRRAADAPVIETPTALGYTDAERDAYIDARVAELAAQPEPPPKPRKKR